jgi:tryptophan synthase alpha chain
VNRIDRLFREKEREILSVYMTAGFPGLDDTPAMIRSLQDHGADLVEIGIPFSDPLADGPVIQRSSQKALGNGITLRILFQQLSGIREKVDIPLILMGYLNPILRFGVERFLGSCRETGIDGAIIPDLPLEEYEAHYREGFRDQGIHHILLITPQTPDERIRKIAGLSDGFIYMVADASTTGAKDSIRQAQVDYFNRIRDMGLPIPAMIGFGISNHGTFATACTYARGAIIGSAFIRMLEQEGFSDRNIGAFIRSIREG